MAKTRGAILAVVVLGCLDHRGVTRAASCQSAGSALRTKLDHRSAGRRPQVEGELSECDWLGGSSAHRSLEVEHRSVVQERPAHHRDCVRVSSPGERIMSSVSIVAGHFLPANSSATFPDVPGPTFSDIASSSTPSFADPSNDLGRAVRWEPRQRRIRPRAVLSALDMRRWPRQFDSPHFEPPCTRRRTVETHANATAEVTR
jgi:hypothetical protein